MLSPSVPSDDVLRAFLLGTLAEERVEAVRAWLDADASNADRLARLAVRDPLTTALADRTPVEPAPTGSVGSVMRRVSDELRLTSDFSNSLETADRATIVQTRPPVAELAWPPQQLGAYRVVREIGRGGMGVVFELADDTLNRRVAGKVLTPDLATRPDATARFLREARAAAKLEHDHVVPILHVGTDEGPPFIIMPLLKGEPLDKRLKREGALPPAEVVRLGREIAAGLGAAHAQGLVHRDMKPANVWLDERTGRARVLDFGLARQGDGTDVLTETGLLQGTPAYMAPEQLDGLPAAPRADLFALGAILYECATGRRAFPGATITAILKAVVTHHPDPPAVVDSRVPAGLSAVIMRLLEKDPAGRLATAAEVAAELAGTAPARTASDATTVTWAGDMPAPASRLRAVWFAGAAAVATAAVAGMFLAARPRTPETSLERPADPPPAPAPVKPDPPAPARYKGKVDVLLARSKEEPLRRLNTAGALPMRLGDAFAVECEVDPPAYLYAVWVDPGHDVTPVYPWNAAKGWGSRPPAEQPQTRLRLPANAGKLYTAPAAKPGVATMVLLACERPLDAPDAVVEGWFKDLPDLPLPGGREDGVMWFDNYRATGDPLRAAFGEVDADAFARWQGRLQQVVGERAAFQTAVSFARAGGK